MKKKLKDATIGELKRFCEKQHEENKRCPIYCPLSVCGLCVEYYNIVTCDGEKEVDIPYED